MLISHQKQAQNFNSVSFIEKKTSYFFEPFYGAKWAVVNSLDRFTHLPTIP